MGNEPSKAELREQLQKAQEALEEEVHRRKGAEERAEETESQQKKLAQEKKVAEEARKRAEERADALQREAAYLRDETKYTGQEAREAWEALREVERELLKAREAEIQAERRLHYQPGLFHFAVAGVSGSGKSSLINAFRGIRNKARGAAPVGVVETTSEVARYPGVPGTPYVWYDVPGAGTLSIPDWQYFTDQGLYIFDCIIVIFDARFTATDIAILRNCVRFQIPSFIVRSKSKQHIANSAADLPTDGDQNESAFEGSEDDEDSNTEERMARARVSYIETTHRSVERELEKAELDSKQQVYLIDKDELVKVVKGKPSLDGIDEVGLLNALFALADRYRPG